MDQGFTPPVADKVKTLDRTSQAVRVFLGGAIGMGIVASAMAFFLFPSEPPASEAPVTSGPQPLKVMDITRAISLPDPLGTTSFTAQHWYAGKTLVYEQPSKISDPDANIQIRNSNDAVSITVGENTVSRGIFGIPVAHAQATTFSIEPLPTSGFIDQYAFLSYRLVGDTADRTMTICLGQSAAGTVYIGTDGSTYTDKQLTQRTTTKSCGDIVSLSNGVKRATEGYIEKEQSPAGEGEYGIVSFGWIHGRINGYRFTPNQSENGVSKTYSFVKDCCSSGDNWPLTNNVGREGIQGGGNTIFGSATDLVSAGDAWESSYTDTDTASIVINPIAFSGGFAFSSGLTITAQSKGVATACGGAFVDQPWSTCWSSVLGNGPESDSSSEQYVAVQFVFDPTTHKFQGVKLVGNDGSSLSGAFHMDVTFVQKIPERIWVGAPLYVGYSPYTGQPNEFAKSIITLRDTSGPVTTAQYLCHPGGTYNTETGGPVFYFDKNGNAYSDMFLANRVMTKNCQDVIAQGLRVSKITSAVTTTKKSSTWTGPYDTWQFRHGFFTIGQITPTGVFTSTFQTGQPAFSSPMYIRPADFSGRTTPVTVPNAKVVLTGEYYPASGATQKVSGTLCLPSITFTPSTRVGYQDFYYDKQFKVYKDIFLSQPLSCTLPAGGGGGGPSKITE